MKNYNPAGALLDSYTYSYDANSNITSIVTSTGTISYQYDALNQLTQETLLDGMVIDYEYDAVGNRTKKTVTQGSVTTTNYTYDVGNQLTAVNGQAYTYDANGNLTGNGAKTFVYDEENRLKEVKDSGGNSLATYIYDYTGKRASMTTSSGTVNYHYAGNNVIYETDASNNIVTDYTWDAKGYPVTMTKNGTTYYYQLNGHGDVVKMTDASGNVVAQYQYDAYGNILSQTGSMALANPYRYAGYRYDESTGLYYLMARYYDASVGRFITRDSFYGFENDPISFNQYDYCRNSPIMYSDPSGYAYKHYYSEGYEYYETSYTFGAIDYYSAQIANYGLSLFIGLVVYPLKLIPKVGAAFASAAAYILGTKVKSIPPKYSKVTMTYRRYWNSKTWYGRNVVTTSQGWTFDDTGWFHTNISF